LDLPYPQTPPRLLPTMTAMMATVAALKLTLGGYLPVSRACCYDLILLC
jgi:hypothetical protein